MIGQLIACMSSVRSYTSSAVTMRIDRSSARIVYLSKIRFLSPPNTAVLADRKNRDAIDYMGSVPATVNKQWIRVKR